MKRFRRVLQSFIASTSILLGLLVPAVLAQNNCVSPPDGLIGWWPGDGDANDIAGGNHGLFSGATYAAGRVGQAFSFDGSGDHVRVAASASLDVGLGAGLTIEAWINPADLTSQGPIVEWAVIGQYALHFYANAVGPGRLYANLVAADHTEHPIYTSDNTLTENAYQHVALTYDRASGMARLYHNGIVVAEASLGTFTPRTASDLYLGYRPAGSPYGPVAFHGQIDEVSIYDRALTVNEMQALFAAGSAGKCHDPAPCTIPGMVAWWRGDGDAQDSQGTHDGVPFSGAAFAGGKAGSAFDLTAPGSHVRVPDSEALHFSQAFTVEAWVKPLSSGTDRAIAVKWDAILGPEQRSFVLGLGADDLPYLGLSSTGGAGAVGAAHGPSAPVAPGRWAHVAGTYNGEAIRIYVDGQLAGEAPYSSGIFPGTSDLGIGGVVGGTPPGEAISTFAGFIDELSLYDRALSAAEVQGIFAAGAAGKCTEAGPCTIPGMVTWWRGEEDGADSHGAQAGELLNGVEFVPGQVGSAFRFDGLDARVRVPASPELDLWKAPGLTVEGWVWPEQLNPVMVIAEWQDAASGRLGVHLVLNIPWPTEGSPAASVWANLFDGVGTTHAIASAPGLLAAQQWSHVALTRDADDDLVRLFLNGTIVAEQAMDFSGSTPVTDVDFWLGGRPPQGSWGSYPFEGLLDEVSLYRRALAPAEIQAIYQAGALGKCASPSPRQPLARWAFDETEGTTASDSIGTRHGTLSAAGAQFTTDGIRGNAIQLSRADGGYVNMGPELVVGNVFTLVAWVKTEPNDTTETMVVAGQHAAGTVNGYYLSLNRLGLIGEPGKAMFVASDPDGQELVSTSDVNDGQWHQIAAVYQGGGQKRLYVDGQPAEAVGAAGFILANTAPFLVGGVTVGGVPQGFFQGWIDEVQLHGRALADVEVEYLFRHPDAEDIPELLEPRIVEGLVPQNVERGTPTEFSVKATGQEPLSYVWSKDDAVLEGVDGPALVLVAVQPTDGAVYSVMVSNAWGNASSSATLRVLWPPVITEAPVGQGVSLGESVTLPVTAEGAAPLQYMWLRNGRPVTGATSRFLLISSATAMSAGDYQVRVANADGAVVSDPVKVWVYSGIMTAQVAAGGLQFEVLGLQAGGTYVLEYTGAVPAPLSAWQPLVTVVDAATSFQFTDPDPPTQGHRYYRLRKMP